MIACQSSFLHAPLLVVELVHIHTGMVAIQLTIKDSSSAE